MALGRLLERLFVQVRADLSQLSGDLAQGVGQTRTATQQMARQWETVSTSIENLNADLQRGLITQGQYMSQMNRHASQVAALSGNYREAQRQVHNYAASLQRAAAAIPAATRVRPMQNFGRSAGMARMQVMNLGFQLNDIGQTLATGMNPLTVMIQQGSQILQIYAGQGGVRAAFGDLSRILLGLGKRLWPIAAIAGGFAILQREINKTSETTVSFMDTFTAVFQVLWRKVVPFIEGPLSWLQEKFGEVLDFIGTWFPRIMNGIIRIMVIAVRSIGAAWDLLPDLWHDTWTLIKNFAIQAVEDIINFVTQDMVAGMVRGVQLVINAFKFAFESIKIVWGQFPDIMADAIGGAVNFVVDGVEKMVNGAIDGINKLLQGLQAIVDFVGADRALEFFGFSGTLPTISEQDLSQWRMDVGNAVGETSGEIAAAAGRIFRENWLEEAARIDPTDLSGHMDAYRNAYGELGRRINQIITESMGTDFMGDFFDEVRTQAIENALRRVAEGVEDIGGAAQSAADEIEDMMEKLEEGLTTAADNLAEVFGNAFERLAETGRFTFRDFVQDMNRLIIKSTSELLQQELSNLFQSLATSRGGLGSLFSNLFTGLFGGGNFFGARARGGVEMPWRNFVAGEEGPELIEQDGPAGARRVSTAGRTAAMMSQGGQSPIVVNQYIQTPDVEGFRQSQGQIAARATMFLARGRRNQ